jgi:hypothetical protein
MVELALARSFPCKGFSGEVILLLTEISHVDFKSDKDIKICPLPSVMAY